MTATTVVVPFQFQSSQLRALNLDGEPWIIARDACSILGLSNVSEALKGLDEDEKSSIDPNIIIGDVGIDGMMAAIPEAGRGGKPLALVNESGLYALIFKSRKPEARAFRKWVTSEVLPAIRRTVCFTPPLTTALASSNIAPVSGTTRRLGLASDAYGGRPPIFSWWFFLCPSHGLLSWGRLGGEPQGSPDHMPVRQSLQPALFPFWRRELGTKILSIWR